MKALLIALIFLSVAPLTQAQVRRVETQSEFNTFHELGVEYVEPVKVVPEPSPQLSIRRSIQTQAVGSPEARVVSSNVRLPDGFRCGGPAECESNICVKQGTGRKVCAAPGVSCRGQNKRCSNDRECCSKLCSNYGTCIADGMRECVPNGKRYVASPDECCSRAGSVTTMECMPSQHQCLRLDEPCIQHTQCCSNTCSSYGTCSP
jgi:hypothetical protein